MNAFKKIYNLLGTAMIVVIVVLAILLAGVRLFGITPYVVVSGSMEPTFHVGSVVYVVEVDAYDMKKGDPVTYKVGTTVVTHRIDEVIKTGVDKTSVRYVTKGDANKTADLGEPLHPSNVIGKPIFSIPVLGYIANFVQNPPGFYIALAFCLGLLLLGFVPEIIGSGKEVAEEARQKAAKEEEERDQLKRMREELALMQKNVQAMQNMQNAQNMQNGQGSQSYSGSQGAPQDRPGDEK